MVLQAQLADAQDRARSLAAEAEKLREEDGKLRQALGARGEAGELLKELTAVKVRSCAWCARVRSHRRLCLVGAACRAPRPSSPICARAGAARRLIACMHGWLMLSCVV